MLENEIKISQISQNQIFEFKPKMLDLVTVGYGFPKNEADSQFQYEYLANPDLVVFGSFSNGELVGTLVVEKTPYLLLGHTAFNVHGIVRFPDYAGKNIGGLMYSQAIDQLGINILVGLTKSPGAVVTRASGCGPKGMQTFYGDFEVITGKVLVKSSKHVAILNEYLANINEEKVGSAVLLDPSLLKSDKVTKVPTFLLPAFDLLNLVQEETGNAKTVVFPTISVIKELL